MIASRAADGDVVRAAQGGESRKVEHQGTARLEHAVELSHGLVIVHAFEVEHIQADHCVECTGLERQLIHASLNQLVEAALTGESAPTQDRPAQTPPQRPS